MNNSNDPTKDQFVGDVIGNESMQTEGITNNGSSKVRETASDMGKFMDSLSNQVTGGVKNTYNAATGNTDTEPINKTHKTQNK
ncbi:hypothetical protein G6F37_004862 [Rhizopus arrhizus]|nr:hypothetical protein G6F38_009372 [Rhizopus arrhizus]KAG1159472.1 hypothetical protein G6F37_004862 [Rhizopus arrhizus]